VFRTIRWKLITGSLLAIIVPLTAMALILGTLLWNFYIQQLSEDVRSRAAVIADFASPILAPPNRPTDRANLANIVARWGHYSSMRVTIASPTGVIVAGTVASDVGKHVQKINQPGLLEALRGKENSLVWKNPNFGYEDSMYVNKPVLFNGRVIGAVRVAYTLTEIQQGLKVIRRTLISGIAIYAFLIITLTLGLAQSIVRPVEKLNRSAQTLASGALDHRVVVEGTEEIQHLGETLNQMAARLQELEGLRRQYVSDVSHELRTPLAAIRSMAETLLVHSDRDPSLPARYLPRIVSQTDRLARLASQLLDLAQIESGSVFLRLSEVSLHGVLEEVTTASSAAANARAVNLVTDIPESLPPLFGDHDRLVQVFLNLVDNAIRYTPAGGTVSVSAWREDDNLVTVVADNGQGMDAAHLSQIFERFYRVDPARSRTGGGSGLGLSIVRQIVALHDGVIRVVSAPGEGTRFTMTIPIRSADLPRASNSSPRGSQEEKTEKMEEL